MTITGWIVFGILAVTIAICGFGFGVSLFDKKGTVFTIGVTVLAIAGLLAGMLWYFSNTASGRRAMIDQKSDLNNGMDRTITVYTADGKEIAKYEGKIDISSADGYVKFDFDGKRYIYYNCFVEAIADISD